MILTTSTEKSNLHRLKDSKTADVAVREHKHNFSSQFLADMRPSDCDQQNTGRDILLLFLLLSLLYNDLGSGGILSRVGATQQPPKKHYFIYLFIFRLVYKLIVVGLSDCTVDKEF